MSCPYLAQITMSYCRAARMKKYVPTASVVTESACDLEYGSCPVYRDAVARAEGKRASSSPHAAVTEERGRS